MLKQNKIIALIQSLSLLFLLLSIIPGTVWGLAIKASVTQGHAPLTVDFLAISHNSSGIPHFSWSTSDGQSYSSSDGRAQFTFYNTGTYRVTLSEPAQGSASVTIIVPEVSAPIPSFVISDASAATTSSDSDGESASSSTASVNTAPAPFIASLDASSSTNIHGNIIDYLWTASDGQTANGINTSMVFSEPGSYIISLTITNSNLISATSNQQIVVTTPIVISNQPPQASFIASTNIGQTPLVIELDAQASTDSDGSIDKYQWTVDGRESYYGINTVISIIEVGVHNILLVVTDNEGETAISNQDVIVLDNPDEIEIDAAVNQPPIAVFSATPSGGTDGNNVVLPLTVFFDASNSNDLDGFITEYAWTVEPLPSPDFPQPLLGEQTSIAFPDYGIFTVNLTVTDNSGATSSSHQQVSVLNAPVESSADIVDQSYQKTARVQTVNFTDKSISRGVVDNTGNKLTSGFQVLDSQALYYIHAYAADNVLNPQIHLYSYPQMQRIDENSDWYKHKSASEMYAKGLVYNKGISQINKEDAAMLVTLSPGWYIVEVSPENISGLGILDIKQIQLK